VILSFLQFGDEGQQGHVPRAFDRYGQLPLVLGAHARLAARANLAAIAHKPAKQINVLVIDAPRFLIAKVTNLAAWRKTAATTLSKVAHS